MQAEPLTIMAPPPAPGSIRSSVFHGLTQRMPENKTICLFASIIAKHTADYVLQEGHKLIPGGVVVSKIITNTLNEVRKENLKAEKLQASSQEKVVTPSIKEMVSNEGYHLDIFSHQRNPRRFYQRLYGEKILWYTILG